jgi:hypothetical protein
VSLGLSRLRASQALPIILAALCLVIAAKAWRCVTTRAAVADARASQEAGPLPPDEGLPPNGVPEEDAGGVAGEPQRAPVAEFRWECGAGPPSRSRPEMPEPSIILSASELSGSAALEAPPPPAARVLRLLLEVFPAWAARGPPGQVAAV